MVGCLSATDVLDAEASPIAFRLRLDGEGPRGPIHSPILGEIGGPLLHDLAPLGVDLDEGLPVPGRGGAAAVLAEGEAEELGEGLLVNLIGLLDGLLTELAQVDEDWLDDGHGEQPDVMGTAGKGIPCVSIGGHIHQVEHAILQAQQARSCLGRMGLQEIGDGLDGLPGAIGHNL
eukprot:11353846-Heterocapsa_arctica.AAC.1